MHASTIAAWLLPPDRTSVCHAAQRALRASCMHLVRTPFGASVSIMFLSSARTAILWFRARLSTQIGPGSWPRMMEVALHTESRAPAWPVQGLAFGVTMATHVPGQFRVYDIHGHPCAWPGRCCPAHACSASRLLHRQAEQRSQRAEHSMGLLCTGSPQPRQLQQAGHMRALGSAVAGGAHRAIPRPALTIPHCLRRLHHLLSKVCKAGYARCSWSHPSILWCLCFSLQLSGFMSPWYAMAERSGDCCAELWAEPCRAVGPMCHLQHVCQGAWGLRA
jgi:hypothetical protein